MTNKGSYTLIELAEITGAKLVGDSSHSITGAESLETATSSDASFLANSLYIKDLKKSKAGVVFLSQSPDFALKTNYLIHSNPSKAFQQVIELFHDASLFNTGFENIHPTAVIHATAKIASNVEIGPYTIIDQNVEIGSNTKIYGHVSIGPHTKIGESCTLYPLATIRENCEIHNHVTLQSGAVIGACGFGYITTHLGVHNKLKHVGKVVLEDHVEVGANTTIDRARFTETRIKAGTKVDNLVQIGHGVEIGENSLIISQTGIAGSSKLGKFTVLAGQVGIVGHINIADHTTVAARGAITKNITKPGGRFGGAPAVSADKYYRQEAHIKKLDTYVDRIKELEKKITELQSEISSK